MTSTDPPTFNPSPSDAPLDPHAAQPGEVFHVGEAATPPPPVGTAPAEAGADVPVDSSSRGSGVARVAFIALLIYASAATVADLGLLYLLFMKPPSPLESLPDVVPPRDANGNVSRILVPPDARLPAGHTLALGESQRFGDLLVTPLRVTREPLEFVHYRGERTREPAGEVLKLWLRFENVSKTGKTFAPLDGDLLFYRKQEGDLPKANNYLARADDRSPENLIFVYDHPPQSDWDLAGQKLGTPLAPGESVETFVPSEVTPGPLEGPLAWRVHLRKGIAENGWGVTTLIEVRFDVERIEKS